jgi:hypothetical protein
MPVLSRPAFGPITALAYVTGGTLMCVWTLVWYFTRDYELTRSQWFWVSGIFLTGLTFVLLGLFLGPLGRAARRSELPPPEMATHEAAIQQTAAANPPAAVMPPAAPGAAMPTANPAQPATPAQTPQATQPYPTR